MIRAVAIGTARWLSLGLVLGLYAAVLAGRVVL